MPSAPLLSPPFSKTSCSKTSGIVCGPSRCQKCCGPSSCDTAPCFPISHVSPMRPSNSSCAKPRETKTLDPVSFASLRPSALSCSPIPTRTALPREDLWNTDGMWIPVPYIDANAAKKLFRFKILRFLKRKGLLDDERIALLNSFRNSGFSVDTSPTVWPQDSDGLERIGRYMLRSPSPSHASTPAKAHAPSSTRARPQTTTP